MAHGYVPMYRNRKTKIQRDQEGHRHIRSFCSGRASVGVVSALKWLACLTSGAVTVTIVVGNDCAGRSGLYYTTWGITFALYALLVVHMLMSDALESFCTMRRFVEYSALQLSTFLIISAIMAFHSYLTYSRSETYMFLLLAAAVTSLIIFAAGFCRHREVICMYPGHNRRDKYSVCFNATEVMVWLVVIGGSLALVILDGESVGSTRPPPPACLTPPAM